MDFISYTVFGAIGVAMEDQRDHAPLAGEPVQVAGARICGVGAGTRTQSSAG